MIGRLIMIAVRSVPRTRPGPARQHMPAMPVRNLKIERDIAAAKTADRLLERVGPRPHRLEPVRSEEHTSELQSLMRLSYAVCCLKKNSHNTCTQRSLQQELTRNRLKTV